jgi:hypothetical protein
MERSSFDRLQADHRPVVLVHARHHALIDCLIEPMSDAIANYAARRLLCNTANGVREPTKWVRIDQLTVPTPCPLL